MGRIVPFFDFQPIVSEFFGHIPEEQGMRPQQIQSPLMVIFNVKQEEILLPKSLIVALRNQSSLVN